MSVSLSLSVSVPWNSSFSRERKAIGSVRFSVRLFVPNRSFEPTNLLTSNFMCVWVATVAGLELKVRSWVKAKRYGQVSVEY